MEGSCNSVLGNTDFQIQWIEILQVWQERIVDALVYLAPCLYTFHSLFYVRITMYHNMVVDEGEVFQRDHIITLNIPITFVDNLFLKLPNF